jgi:hypothetical protein
MHGSGELENDLWLAQRRSTNSETAIADQARSLPAFNCQDLQPRPFGFTHLRSDGVLDLVFRRTTLGVDTSWARDPQIPLQPQPSNRLTVGRHSSAKSEPISEQLRLHRSKRIHHQKQGSRGPQWRDRSDLFSGPILGSVEVIVRLQVEPELCRRPEVAAEPQRGIGGDPSLAVDDLVDPPGGTPIETASLF